MKATAAKDLDRLAMRLLAPEPLSLEERMYYAGAVNAALDLLLNTGTPEVGGI